MHVYLVQHGEAKTEAQDAERPLTDRGRDEVRRVACRAALLGLPLAEICHSGKLRAAQTAELMAEHLRPSRGVRAIECLAPTDDPAKVRAELEAAREPLMLVGHLPHLGRLASSLLVGDPQREILRFRNGAVVSLAREEGRWFLRWILTPELA